MRWICAAFFLTICLFPAVAFSYDITLSWEESGDAVDGYKIFKKAAGQEYDYNSPVYQGAAKQCPIENLEYEVQYSFVARSYIISDSGTLDSDNSNEIIYSRSTPEPETPVDVVDEDTNPVDEDTTTVVDNNDPVVDEGTDSSDSSDTDSGSVVLRHIASYQPVLYAPADGSTRETMTPVLTVMPYTTSAESNVHSMTEWQISSDSNFTALVFNEKSRLALTALNVPQLMLDDQNTYFWRVRFFDESDTASEWSGTWAFTVQLAYTEDGNMDGVPDDLEVNETVDLDGNGIPDIQQDDIKCMNTLVGDSQVGVSVPSEDATIDMIQSIDWDLIGDSENRPKKMPMNLIGFRLLVEPGAEAEVTIYFSEKLPRSAKWFKHDIENGWQDFSDYTEFSTTKDGRTKVTFVLKDGGFGDEDGIANGIIVDPSGPALESLEETGVDAVGVSDTGAGADSGGGCFIGSGLRHRTPAASKLFPLLLMGMALVGLRKSRKL